MHPEATLKRPIPGVSVVLEDRTPFRWGFGLLLVFTLLMVGRIQEMVPAMQPFRTVLVFGGLAALLWLLAPGALQDKIPMRLPQVKYVVWLFLLALLLVPVGVWPGNSVDFIVGTYSKVILFFLMVVFWTRTIGDVRGIMWAGCLGVSAAVLLTLAFGLGKAERFQTGGTYDANDLAFVLVMALPLMVYLFSISRLPLKLLVSGMIFISLYGVVLTQSRAGFLALVVVGLLILFRSRGGMAAKVGIVALALVVFGSLAGVQYWDRMSTIWSPQSAYDETAGGRTILWKAGLKILASHPVGVGIHNYHIAEGMSHGGAGKWNTAHNSFLELGVELGVAGLVVFIVLITATIRDLRRIQANSKSQLPPKTFSRQATLEAIRVKGPIRESLLPLASALETSLLGFVVGGFFLSQAYSPILYCVLGLSLACRRMQETDKPAVITQSLMKNERTAVPRIVNV